MKQIRTIKYIDMFVPTNDFKEDHLIDITREPYYKKITDVKFDGKGCAICMACSSVLTEMIKGKDLDAVKKFEKDELNFESVKPFVEVDHF